MEVAVEKSFDVLVKSWQSRIFTKLHHSIRTSGLLARMSDKDFRTLVCLSTFMDAEGKCFPSQEALSRALGISRTAVTKRMKTLLAFRWQSKPLISAQKVRSRKGKFENTVYTILPESSLSIFNSSKNKISHVSTSHVAECHTNDSHTNNKIYNTVTEINKFNQASVKPIGPLALQLANDMDDMRSLPYYKRAVATTNPGILLRARGEVLEEKKIKKSKGAMFAYLVKKHVAQSLTHNNA